MGILFGTKVKTFLLPQLGTTDHTIEAGLVVQVYAYAKKQIGVARGIPNTVTQQRKIDKFDKTMLNIANQKKFRMFRNTTISEFKNTIT